jgi:hypothetical protein
MIADEVWQGYEWLLRTAARTGVVQEWWAIERETFDPEVSQLVDRMVNHSSAV